MPVQSRARLSRTVTIADTLPLTARRWAVARVRSVQPSVQPGCSIADIGELATRSRGAERIEPVRKVE